MTKAWLLGQRAIREALRTPEALLPTLFIPLFFLVVNVGQAAKIFPSDQHGVPRGSELRGLPAAELDPARRVLRQRGALPRRGHRGRLLRQAAGGPGVADRHRARPAGRRGREERRRSPRSWCCSRCRSASRIASGPLGFLLLILLTAAWAVVFAGFMQLIALKTRSAAATNSAGLVFFPLLFLTPNFVPRDLLTRPMEIAATFNPVTYIMEALRSLILDDLAWAAIGRGFAVVAVLGALMVVLNVRTIRSYD